MHFFWRRACGWLSNSCGSAEDTRPDVLGAVVSSSRGITFPYKPDDADWEARIEAALRETIAALEAVSG